MEEKARSSTLEAVVAVVMSKPEGLGAGVRPLKLRSGTPGRGCRCPPGWGQGLGNYDFRGLTHPFLPPSDHSYVVAAPTSMPLSSGSLQEGATG